MKRNIVYILLTACVIAFLTLCSTAIHKGDTREAVAYGCCAGLECMLILLVNASFRLQDLLEEEVKYANETAGIRDDAMKLAEDSLKNVDKMVKMNEELLADNRGLFTIIEEMQEYVPEEAYEKINAQLSGTRHLFQKVDGKYELYSWVK